MNFYPRKRRTPVLQIISLIDILIILLIFLVVSTSFKEIQPALNITLPTSKELALGSTADSRLSLALTAEERIFLQGAEIPGPKLATALAELRRDRPEAKLELRIDEKASFRAIIELWDGLTRAGFPIGDVPARVLRGSSP